jgi:hypothetical protein
MNIDQSSGALGGPTIRANAATRRRHALELVHGIREKLTAHPGGALDVEALSHIRASCNLLRHCIRGDLFSTGKSAELEQWAIILYSARASRGHSPDVLRDWIQAACSDIAATLEG